MSWSSCGKMAPLVDSEGKMARMAMSACVDLEINDLSFGNVPKLVEYD